MCSLLAPLHWCCKQCKIWRYTKIKKTKTSIFCYIRIWSFTNSNFLKYIHISPIERASDCVDLWQNKKVELLWPPQPVPLISKTFVCKVRSKWLIPYERHRSSWQHCLSPARWAHNPREISSFKKHPLGVSLQPDGLTILRNFRLQETATRCLSPDRWALSPEVYNFKKQPPDVSLYCSYCGRL